MEHKIKLLLDSYGLEFLMQENDITEEFVLEFLIDEKKIDLEDYFDD